MIEKIKRGFKRKTIVKNITEKMDEWIKSLPQYLQDNVRKNYVVTGGAIASMLGGDLPNDYDIYLIDSVVLFDLIKFYRNPQSIFSSYKPVMTTPNAISLSGDIQIITRFVGSPEDIHENFDFAHTTNWFTEKDGLVLNPAAIEAILAKELKYQGSLYPVCALFRIKKFLQRGWTITAGEMFKISYDISKLQLNDIQVLKNQLVGIDAAYFIEVIELLEKHEGDIDRTVIFELINRAFD